RRLALREVASLRVDSKGSATLGCVNEVDVESSRRGIDRPDAIGLLVALVAKVVRGATIDALEAEAVRRQSPQGQVRERKRSRERRLIASTASRSEPEAPREPDAACERRLVVLLIERVGPDVKREPAIAADLERGRAAGEREDGVDRAAFGVDAGGLAPAARKTIDSEVESEPVGRERDTELEPRAKSRRFGSQRG